MYLRTHLMLLRNFNLHCYHYDNKTFRFVNAHLTASNKGELANQNTAYKNIPLELAVTICVAEFFIFVYGIATERI